MKTVTNVTMGLAAVLLLGGCAATPMGPTVQVMPAPNKPFEVFQAEQASCKQYAADQVNGQAEAANNTAIGTTLLGSALGAGLGAAVGGGHGAAVGAAAGGVMGTAVGASNSQRGGMSIQQQYNNAYSQCMYAKGNQVAQPQPHYVVVQPPPVVYTPPPVVYTQPPVVYAPPPGYAPAPGYAPPPAGYAPPPGAAAMPPPPPPPGAQ